MIMQRRRVISVYLCNKNVDRWWEVYTTSARVEMLEHVLSFVHLVPVEEVLVQTVTIVKLFSLYAKS